MLFVFHVAVGQNNTSNSTVNWKTQWVTATEHQNETNNWTAYNKTFKVGEVPDIAPDVNMQGKPLTDIYKEESDTWRKQFYYEQLSLLPNIPRSQGIRTVKYKYLYDLDAPFGYEELYDLENDPDETNNLAPNSVNKEVLEDLRNRVKKNYDTSMFKNFSPLPAAGGKHVIYKKQ